MRRPERNRVQERNGRSVIGNDRGCGVDGDQVGHADSAVIAAIGGIENVSRIESERVQRTRQRRAGKVYG